MLDVRDLIRIQAVLTHGGFTRAAAALGMTQPALTRSIAAAEALAGGSLFRRSRLGAEPTALCRLVLADAPEVIARMQALHERLGQLRGGSGEEVAVATGPFPMDLCLGATAAFRRAHPRVRVRLETLPWPAALAQLRAGLCDLAVVTSGASFEGGPFVVETLPPQPMAFVVAPGHPLARAARVTVPQVLDWPLVTTAHLAPRLQTALAEGRRTARRRPDLPCPAVLVESTAAWLALVAGGDYVALAPPSAAAAALARGEVTPLPLSAPWLAGGSAIVHLATRPPGPAAVAFGAAVRAEAAAFAAQQPVGWRP